uniref:Folate receptor-like domain-containing protein n=1 Tax=Mustela putorius furo TaxID=9669 RepID=M3YEQ8_MUSPF
TLPSCHRIQRLTWPSWWLTQLLLLQVGAATVSAAQPRTELLNICMDVKPRKEKPRPENKLHKRKNPCCFANITWEAQKGISHLYRLNWDHCGQTAPACSTSSRTPTSMSAPPGALGPAGEPQLAQRRAEAGWAVCTAGKAATLPKPMRTTVTKARTGCQDKSGTQWELPAPLPFLLPCTCRSVQATTAEAVAPASRYGLTQHRAIPTGTW